MLRKYARYIAAVLLVSLLVTISSYLIVTGRNVHLEALKGYTTLSGKYIVNLPCAAGPSSAPESSDWQSYDPVLPETRGLPLNYHFWNPCSGHQILREGFLLDWAFWAVI
jgi:hypothetical protein